MKYHIERGEPQDHVLGGRSVCVETLLGRSELERFVRAPAFDSQLCTVFLPNVFGPCTVELYACAAKQYHGGMQHIPGRGDASHATSCRNYLQYESAVGC